jgi:hypothetical protein
VKRNTDVEATIVGKFVAMSPLLDERARRLWAAVESAAIGYRGDAVLCHNRIDILQASFDISSPRDRRRRTADRVDRTHWLA